MNIPRIIRSLTTQQILVIIFGGILFIGATFQVIEAQPEFCKSCHEMEFHYDTWATSTHVDEADCLDCHTEPGVMGFIDAKMRALGELIAHITRDYEVPIQSNVRVKDGQCLSCHPEASSIPDYAVDAKHDIHLENSVLCADCHSRIVHADVDEPNIIQAKQCDDCHNSHTEFSIQGKHSELKCSDCHLDGVYEAISNLCQDCHEVPVDHVEGVYSNCDACHTDSGWDLIGFDHITIALKGGHESLSCVDCHEPGTYEGLTPDCESCHDLPEPHVDIQTQACIDCHTVNGWSPAEFDHSFYLLIGKHVSVSCSECHIDGQYVDTTILCMDCHDPPIEHALDIDETCDLCHTEDDWKAVTFNHDDFPLIEGHSDVPCVDCHIDNAYESATNLCEGCHNAPIDHAVNIDTECEACHTISGWVPATFDHTSYPLTGAHIDVSCGDCHTGPIYSETPSDCIDCHSEPAYHAGLPDCTECHTTSNFASSTYMHPRIKEHYPGAPGEDERLDCIDCHQSTYAYYSCMGTGCHSTNNPKDD